METVVGETDFPQFIYQRKLWCYAPILYIFHQYGFRNINQSSFSVHSTAFLSSQQIACQALKLLLHKKKRYWDTHAQTNYQQIEFFNCFPLLLLEQFSI